MNSVLQILFNRLDQAPIDDMLVALAMLAGLLGAWVVCRITRRRK